MLCLVALASCGAVKDEADDPCAPSPCASNATCAASGESFTCTCDAGYTGDGATCAPVTCMTLTPPANGTVSTTGTMVGGTAMYACDLLYRPQGAVMRTCEADGTWSGSAPTCAACQAGQRMIVASQSVSVNYDSNNAGVFSYRDNSTRAYSNPTGSCGAPAPCDITGWFGFDVTAIPDTAVIQAMTLHAFANTVQMDPTVRLQYSTANNWTRASSPPADLARTIAQVSAPLALTATNANTFVALPVNVSAANWTVDLTDNWLTLGIDNPLTTYTYAYFNGADTATPDNRAYVAITYCD